MATSMPGEKQVDLLLLGKTGHGKSATANAILGRREFVVSDNAESETYDVLAKWARRMGRLIKVVDTPGLCENRLEKGQATKKAVKDMEQCILQCTDGFHALLLVFKYGNRFTEEERETIGMLKSIFGDTFVRDYCILIFTHGEIFDLNNEDEDAPEKTFKEWCEEQRGALQDVLAECNYKAVLFRNKRKAMQEQQLQELLSVVDTISRDGRRYRSEIFEKAAIEREKLIVRKNAPKLREMVQEKINLLVDGLEKLKAMTKFDQEAQKTVAFLREDGNKLLTSIDGMDKGTGVLDALRQDVGRILSNLASHVEIVKSREEAAKVQKKKDEMEKKFQALRDETAEMRSRMQEELRQMERTVTETRQRAADRERELEVELINMRRHAEPPRGDDDGGFWSTVGTIIGVVGRVVISALTSGLLRL